MAPLTLPVNDIPLTGSAQISSPFVAQIVVTPTGAADGGFNVSWEVYVAAQVGNAGTALAGGALRMLPTDFVAKLFYQIRAGMFEGFKKLTLAQILPSQPDTNVTATSGSYVFMIEIDPAAVLPSNPSNVGL